LIPPPKSFRFSPFFLPGKISSRVSPPPSLPFGSPSSLMYLLLSAKLCVLCPSTSPVVFRIARPLPEETDRRRSFLFLGGLDFPYSPAFDEGPTLCELHRSPVPFRGDGIHFLGGFSTPSFLPRLDGIRAGRFIGNLPSLDHDPSARSFFSLTGYEVTSGGRPPWPWFFRLKKSAFLS